MMPSELSPATVVTRKRAERSRLADVVRNHQWDESVHTTAPDKKLRPNPRDIFFVPR
jgi:hypothetical protein